MTTPFRCGDIVRHKPTGETWVVAWDSDGTIAPAGWPDCRGLTSDCEMVRAASDEEHVKSVDDWLGVKGDSRVDGIRRIYVTGALS